MLRTIFAIVLLSMSTGLAGCTVPVEDFQDICQKNEITQEELAELRKRPDFQALLDYALENCPEVALQLIDQDTGSIIEPERYDDDNSGNGPPSSGGGDDDSCNRPVC